MGAAGDRDSPARPLPKLPFKILATGMGEVGCLKPDCFVQNAEHQHSIAMAGDGVIVLRKFRTISVASASARQFDH